MVWMGGPGDNSDGDLAPAWAKWWGWLRYDETDGMWMAGIGLDRDEWLSQGFWGPRRRKTPINNQQRNW